MDFLPEPLITLIQQHPTIQHLTETPLASHLAALHSAYLTPCIAHLRSTYLDPYLIHPLATLLASSMPNLLSVLILALVLFVSLKILDYTRRLVMFWVNLTLRLIWWAVVLAGVYYVYNAGFEKTGRDLGWVYGVVKGFVDGFADGVEGGRSTATTMGWDGYVTGVRDQQQQQQQQRLGRY
ncbi:hypothetical protein BO71DRAFT_400763 [Aspergillus ellipticus CBS 707.79]|uniref:Nuclear pore assembly and biogenesis-domain-containing protein n=1 Tax=Aspergillus ellipticus CBS 707.79 TaxID=1448320 RepID=A0A319D4X6_9EURO|nr:hypothetical protein BO71DRAFT_400763 [Aspergillus ellipticus CBS 707.79]